MKRENLKRNYDIREMRKEEIEKMMNENESYKILSFENESDYFMIRENKKNLFIIHEISEKKERRHLDKDIKIESRKLNDFNIKLIYHRDKNLEKEYRIFISFKDENKKLIRKRLRNELIDSISRDEKKMIEYYRKISEKELKDIKKIS